MAESKISADDDSFDKSTKDMTQQLLLEEIQQPFETQFLYHIKNKKFVGTWILPLNKMPTMANFESEYKTTYETQRSKYDGREWLLDITIPTLDGCLWNDVIFMSPIHPNYIYSEYKSLGLPVDDFESFDFFKIPAARLSSLKTSIWIWPDVALDVDSPEVLFAEEFFQLFDPNAYKEMDKLPTATKSHFAREAIENCHRRPRWLFFGIPHVLTTEPIDTAGLEIINWRESGCVTNSK